MNKTARLKRLSRHLLATTCLTAAAAGAANATTITESPEPGGFSTSFASATVIEGLALGPNVSNTVIGETVNVTDKDAYFIFPNGVAGTSFTYSVSVEDNVTGTFQLTDSLTTNLGNTTPFSIPNENNLTSFTEVTSGTGTVPGNGEIVAAVLQGTGSEVSRIYFEVTVVETTAPEPGTSTEIGLGLAGAAVALRRRLRTRKA